MGTTYVIPLALSLFFFKKMFLILENSLNLKTSYIVIYSLILFYIGLTMENIALVMILANICLMLYSYFKFKVVPKYLYIFIFFSLISFTLLRFSPGANARLIRDHQDWMGFSIFKQILINYPNFIRLTFIEHRYLVLTFSGLNILLLVKKLYNKNKISIIQLTIFSVFLIGCLISISLTISKYFNNSIILQFIDYKSIINLIFWPIYIIAIFINSFELNKEDQNKVIFFILLAGLSNGVMMASPIFGFRSSLYTVYFMILATLIYLKSLDLKYLNLILIVPLFIMLIKSTSNLNQKYELVSSVHNVRLGEITYYQKNPNIKEAWLIRYPIFSIHSGDIEQDDLYHMDVFKQYYGLESDLIIFFYYPENGYDSLFNH